MKHFLKTSASICFALSMTACFDLAAQNKSIEIPSDSENNKIILGPKTADDNDVVIYKVLRQPTHGLLEGTGPERTYTPDAYYEGNDMLTFIITDGEKKSNEAKVAIKIIDLNSTEN